MDIAPLGGWPYRSKSSNVHKELKCQVILEVVLAFQEGRDYFLPEDLGWLHGRRAFGDGLEGG